MKRYFGDLSCWDDLKRAFFYGGDPVHADFPTDAEVILATEESGGYEGAIAIYWKRGGKLYESEHSHCSCNAFSDDADSFGAAKPITLEYLAMRHQPYCLPKDPEAQVAWDALLETAL